MLTAKFCKKQTQMRTSIPKQSVLFPPITAVYSARRQNRPEHRQAVNAVVISKPAGAPQYNNQQEDERPRRQFTRLNMTLSQILPQLLKTNMVIPREAPTNPNTTSPKYNPNARCAYRSDSPGHNTDDCWTLKNKIGRAHV